jgi:hypothetical protein
VIFWAGREPSCRSGPDTHRVLRASGLAILGHFGFSEESEKTMHAKDELLRNKCASFHWDAGLIRGRLGGTPRNFVPQLHIASITGISSFPASLSM